MIWCEQNFARLFFFINNTRLGCVIPQLDSVLKWWLVHTTKFSESGKNLQIYTCEWVVLKCWTLSKAREQLARDSWVIQRHPRENQFTRKTATELFIQIHIYIDFISSSNSTTMEFIDYNTNLHACARHAILIRWSRWQFKARKAFFNLRIQLVMIR